MNPSVASKTDRAERKQCTPEIWQIVVVERLAASHFEIGNSVLPESSKAGTPDMVAVGKWVELTLLFNPFDSTSARDEILA